MAEFTQPSGSRKLVLFDVDGTLTGSRQVELYNLRITFLTNIILSEIHA